MGPELKCFQCFLSSAAGQRLVILSKQRSLRSSSLRSDSAGVRCVRKHEVNHRESRERAGNVCRIPVWITRIFIRVKLWFFYLHAVKCCGRRSWTGSGVNVNVSHGPNRASRWRSDSPGKVHQHTFTVKTNQISIPVQHKRDESCLNVIVLDNQVFIVKKDAKTHFANKRLTVWV